MRRSRGTDSIGQDKQLLVLVVKKYRVNAFLYGLIEGSK